MLKLVKSRAEEQFAATQKKAKLALNSMQADQVLKVVATDPGSERDFHLFVEQSDHQILDFQKDERAYSYWIRKG